MHYENFNKEKMNKYIKLIVFILIIGVKMEAKAQTQVGSAEAALLDAGNERTLILKQQSLGNEIGLSFEDANDNCLWNVFTGTNGGLHFRTNDNESQNHKDWSGTNTFSVFRDKFIFLSEDVKVGIGLTDPENSLDVRGTVRAQRFIGDGSHLTLPGKDIVHYVDGHVGIGTTSPGAALDVTPSIEVGESASALRLRAGNEDSDGSDNNNQLLFSSAEESGSYTHAIKSRHNSEQSGGNSLDFYLWDKTADDPGTVGSQHVMSLNGGKVGIGTKDPETELHVAGDVKANIFIGDGSRLTNLPDPGKDIVHYAEGKVGIGIESPETELHVKGDFLAEGSLRVEKKNDKDELVQMHMSTSTGGNGWMGTYSKHNLWLGANNKGLLKLDTLGGVTVSGSQNKPTKVVIRNYGQSVAIADGLASKFNLFATNGIWSEDFAISDKSVLQPDYVFEESYALSSLDFLEDYVKTNKHLPDVPGVSQIEKDGYLSLSEQSTGILKNLEEQVLHNIRQEKKIAAQEKEIKTQAAQIRVQQEMINTLISRIEKVEERLNR